MDQAATLKELLKLSETEDNSDVLGIWLASTDLNDVNLETLHGALEELITSQPDIASKVLEDAPLSVTPKLIPSMRLGNASARQILLRISERGNSKEVILAISEALETLIREADNEDEDDSDVDPQIMELVVYIAMYSSSLPRLVLRKKSPSETLKPHLRDLRTVSHHLSPSMNAATGRDILSRITSLVSALSKWVSGIGSTAAEAGNCQKSLAVFMEEMVSIYSRHLHSSLAQRTFEKLYPRLVLPNRSILQEDGWEEGETTIQFVEKVYAQASPQTPSPSSSEGVDALRGNFIIAAHRDTTNPTRQLSDRFPLVFQILNLQSETGLDEALSFLTASVFQMKKPSGKRLDEGYISPLVSALTPIASMNPDPTTRFIAFRLIASILDLSPPMLHFELLRELIEECPFPQMKAAAVGLLKDAVLAALRSDVPSPLASPLISLLFTKLLYPKPPDLIMSTETTLEEFDESPEAGLVLESLGFYYVLLTADTSNKMTGDSASLGRFMAETKRHLLEPVRQAVAKWQTSSGDANVSVFIMALERVDQAVGSVGKRK